MGESYSKGHWAKDETAKECHACGNKFSFARRRHHCRNCGYIFCADCSFRVQPIPQRNIRESVRVCDSCYFSLLEVNSNCPTTQGGGVAPSTGGVGRPVVTIATAESASRTTSFNTKAAGGGGGGGSGAAAVSNTTTGEAAGAGTAKSGGNVTAVAVDPASSGGPAPPAATKMNAQQEKMERLTKVVQKIRAEAIYLDATTSAVEGTLVDEQVVWADQADYTLMTATPGDVLIPFPNVAVTAASSSAAAAVSQLLSAEGSAVALEGPLVQDAHEALRNIAPIIFVGG